MAASNKETIYIDVDDEITNIIDKVKVSDQKIIALVLPKRATVLQSVVNMKLLKKASENAKKNIVLITSESGLLPLAAVAGLHVAKSLQSKPVIPPLPNQAESATDEPEIIADDGKPLDMAASIGTLAAATKADDETETIELDNVNMDSATAPAAAGVSSPLKKLKHLKVPNFERFRSRFFLAGLALVLLIVGWIFAMIFMPKAIITIRTDTTTLVSSFDFTASENITELDANDKKVPATLKEIKKTDSEKTPATGERDDGTKAKGEVTLKLSDCSEDEVTVPKGTIVSADGLNFITQDSATMQSVEFGGGCQNDALPSISSETVDVVSADNGDKFNIGSGKTFSVSGNSNVTGSNNDGFDGGTSKIVKVVSQKDVDDAVAKITARADSEVDEEFKTMFEAESLMALTETKKAGKQKITASPAVNKEATEVTVTADLVYTMLGVKKDDLIKLVENDVSAEIDTEQQAITDHGIDSAILRLNSQPKPNEALLSFRTSVVAGPEIDQDAVKEAVRGKKRGEAEQYISALPGVEEVVVDYSPFWVYSTPKAAKKITIIVEKPADSADQQTEADESE
ncbi:MAG: hypothetical protein M3Q14_01735 [bacterium]|nr:hypothetical protein [bacterium]